MLGKGLESLLPKKSSDGKSLSKDAAVSPQPAPPVRTGAFREEAVGGGPSSVSEGVGAPRKQGGVHRGSERTPGSERKVPDRESIFHIEVEKITPNPYQPRRAFKEEELEELAASIREFGVLQPIVVTKRVEEAAEGTRVEYELIAGERRLLAAKRAGLPRVPAIVRQADSRQTKLEMALIENVQRRDLSALETARAYVRLQEEFGLTQREIGERVGKSREAVANTLRLLQLPTETQKALAEGTITEAQARALLSQGAVARRGRPAARPPSPEDIATVRALEEKLGTPVKVIRTKKGGAITITFYSDDEYRGVRSRLLGEDY